VSESGAGRICGMDRTRAHNKAVRHRTYRVIVVCFVAVVLVSTVVHLRSYWTVWKLTVVIGLAVVAGAIVVGIAVDHHHDGNFTTARHSSGSQRRT